MDSNPKTVDSNPYSLYSTLFNSVTFKIKGFGLLFEGQLDNTSLVPQKGVCPQRI